MNLVAELRAVLGGREPGPPRPSSSPTAIEEEEAAGRLYGERTGTVNASPASPPVEGRADERGTESGPPEADAPAGDGRGAG